MDKMNSHLVVIWRLDYDLTMQVNHLNNTLKRAAKLEIVLIL